MQQRINKQEIAHWNKSTDRGHICAINALHQSKRVNMLSTCDNMNVRNNSPIGNFMRDLTLKRRIHNVLAAIRTSSSILTGPGSSES